MKILFLTSGPIQLASTRVRVTQYFKYLNEKSYQCKLIVPFKDRSFVLLSKLLYLMHWLKIIFYALTAKVIFIQRNLFSIKELNLIKIINRKIIFDFDDALFVNHSDKNYKDNTKQKLLLASTLKNVQQVIVSTNYLKDYAKQYNKNIVVIPSVIDTDEYTIKNYSLKNNNKIILGYTSSVWNLYYLQLIKNALKNIFKKHNNVCLEIISGKDFYLDGVKIINKKFKIAGHVKALQNFDIGLEPLADDSWTRGKAGFKGLEYMACGIPTISSPVGINVNKIQDGVNGFLANSENEWFKKLSLLIENYDLRKKMGLNGRKMVEQYYSLKKTVPKFIYTINKMNK